MACPSTTVVASKALHPGGPLTTPAPTLCRPSLPALGRHGAFFPRGPCPLPTRNNPAFHPCRPSTIPSPSQGVPRPPATIHGAVRSARSQSPTRRPAPHSCRSHRSWGGPLPAPRLPVPPRSIPLLSAHDDTRPVTWRFFLPFLTPRARHRAFRSVCPSAASSER